MRFIVAIALLLSLSAYGQFVSYPVSASSSSVVTNTATNAYNFITNGTFATGTQGWVVVNTPADYTWDEAGQRYQLLNYQDSQAKINFGQTFTAPVLRLSFTYAVTNGDTNCVITFRIACDDFEQNAGAAFLVPPSTSGVTIVTNIARTSVTENVDSWVGTQFMFSVIGFSEDMTTNGVFFDNFSLVDTNYFQSSITTNSGSGVGGASISIGNSKVGVSRQ